MRNAAIICITALVATGCAQRREGILVMAHGGNADWNHAVERTVEPLRQRWPVEIAYGMANPDTLEHAVRRLEQQGVRRIAVVRLFISADSFLDATEYIFGLRDEPPPGRAVASDTRLAAHHQTPDSGHGQAGHHALPALRRIRTRAEIRLSRSGVAESPLIDQILRDRVAKLSRDPRREAVLILAHGPGDDGENQRWLANMRRRAEAIRRLGDFAAIRCETLREDWPDRRAAAEERIRRFVQQAGADGLRVIVIPFRVAGFGPYAQVLEGLDYVADGRGFCPHPNMTRWIEQTARACLR